MKVRKQKLTNLFNLIAMKGAIENKEALLSVSKTEIITRVVSENNIVACRAVLKGEFDDWGEVGIDDLILLKNFINSLNVEEVDMEKLENKINIKSDKIKFSCVLRNPKYIVNTFPEDKYTTWKEKSTGNEFVVSQKTVKEIIQHFNTISPNELTLNGSEKTIKLKLENNQNELVVDISIDQEVKPFKVKLAPLFIDFLSTVEGDLTVSVKDEGSPVYAKVKHEDCEVEYIIAPLN